MNPIKKKLADFLTEMSKKVMDEMDAESPCARYFKSFDSEALFKKDIERICNEVSMLEAGKILSISAKFMLSNTGDEDRYRNEIKSMVSEIAKRLEKKTGNVNLPLECLNTIYGGISNGTK